MGSNGGLGFENLLLVQCVLHVGFDIIHFLLAIFATLPRLLAGLLIETVMPLQRYLDSFAGLW